MLGQHATEEVVHAVHGIADRHGGEGVAVVAASHREQAAALRPAAREPVLKGQLDGDLHGDGARVA
jgi:hypothetical protein